MQRQADPGDDLGFLQAWLQSTSLSRQCQDFWASLLNYKVSRKKFGTKSGLATPIYANLSAKSSLMIFLFIVESLQKKQRLFGSQK
jgi:hypothetical protein